MKREYRIEPDYQWIELRHTQHVAGLAANRPALRALDDNVGDLTGEVGKDDNIVDKRNTGTAVFASQREH